MSNLTLQSALFTTFLFIVPIIAAFLIGSIPFGIIVGSLLFKSDLRESGSGNIGAANALRSYGAVGGVLVLALDALKGFLPVLGYEHFWFPFVAAVIIALVGLAAVIGHCYSPWLRFRGGKGVATFLGMILAQSWIVGLAFVVIWLAIVIPTRFASLGSIVASVLTPVGIWFVWHDWLASMITALAAFLIVWKHRENITRLREGRENKITFGKASA